MSIAMAQYSGKVEQPLGSLAFCAEPQAYCHGMLMARRRKVGAHAGKYLENFRTQIA